MYTNVAELRQDIPNMGDNPNDDALLKRYIQAAQGVIERLTGKVFEATEDTTRTLHAVNDVDGRTLYLRKPLAALAATNPVVNGNGVNVASSEYTLAPGDGPPYRRIVLKANSAVEWTYTGSPENAIQVSGKWADYATPPADIKLACRSLARWFYQRRDSGGIGDTDIATASPTGVLLLPAEWPRDVRNALTPYLPKPGVGSRVVRGRLING